MPQAIGAWPASSSVASLRSATATRLISSLPDSRKAIYVLFADPFLLLSSTSMIFTSW